MSRGEPKIALLVPFSSKERSRIVIWQYVRNWLKQTLDYPIYIGEYSPNVPEEYNASLHRNISAQLAGEWEVAIFHDADTVLNPLQIKEGAAVALETGAVTYPYTERWELTFKGTNMLLNNEQNGWQQHMRKNDYSQPLGGCIIVRRDLWELVRGFDSGFVGWGHEDGAFAMACEVLSGKKLRRVAGKSLHLEHVFSSSKKLDSPLYLANKARIKEYLKAIEQPDSDDLIRQLRDESIKIDIANGVKWPSSPRKRAKSY